jgi:hypothetical protein
MFRNLFLDYLIVAVVSTVLVESPVRQVLSAQVLSHTVESEALVSVLLLQAAKDKVATAIKEKINFFIRLLLTVFLNIITPCYYGCDGRTRTYDQAVNSRLLYH